MGRLDSLFEGLRQRTEALGYKYIGAELVTESDVKILRVYADKDDGLDLDGSETIARELNEFLDAHEASLPPRYFLEVSSPGLERPLFTPEDYREFCGTEVIMKLKGQKKAAGIIESVAADDVVTIARAGGEKLAVPFKEIRKGNLVYLPEVGEKKTFKKTQKNKNKKKR